jgi:hypothetical protein
MALAEYPGFVGGTYRGSPSILGVDRCVNKYPELLESGTGKNKYALVDVPGKDLACTLAASPGRGIWSGDETKVFCVSGSKLYEVSTGSHAATERGDVGNDNEPVQMFSNGLSAGGQLAIISNDKLYVDSGLGPVDVTTCPAAVAAGGNGVAMGATIDGYAFVVEKNTNNVYLSAIGDFTSWDPLDVQAWFAAQDRIVQIIPDASHRLWLMGRKTAEAWGNVGGSGFPFQRIPGGAMNTGMPAKFGWALVPSQGGSDQICFLSRSDRGGPRVYVLDGYRTVRISNNAIEGIIERFSTYLDAVGNGYVRGGHSMFSLHFPTAGVCLVYDFSTDMWHERYSGAWTSYVEPVGRFHTAPSVTNSHYWLSGTTGKLYKENASSGLEDGNAIHWERIGPNAHMADHHASYGTFRLDCEAGISSEPDVKLAVSYDNGVNFGTERTVSTGASGKTRTVVEWHRNGWGRSFVPRLRGNEPCTILNAMIDVEDGSGY